MKTIYTGTQSFQRLIEGNYLYVDKTRYIYDMIRGGMAYFLSRPRRFGKSLLLSTFEALFSGPPDPDGPPQGLFSDLWIGKHSDYDFTQKYPVITFSMSRGVNSPEDLNLYLSTKLGDINNEEKLNLNLTAPNIDICRIIENLSKKYKKQVVILIDEYDAPVSENLANPTAAAENSEMLKGFYSAFKDADKFLRFVFVTGVTRYAFMGLSAGLNQLNDLTLDENYAGVCGFTYEEIESCFKEHLPVVLNRMKSKGRKPELTTVAELLESIKNQYDGYSWDGQTMVLNPFSVINCIDKASLDDFWLSSGPSTKFITSITEDNPFDLLEDKFSEFDRNFLNYAEVGKLEPVAGLFQTGYLTVDKISYDQDGRSLYSLKIPNKEVRKFSGKAFSGIFKTLYTRLPSEETETFKEAIKALDAPKVTEMIASIFSGLPAVLNKKDEASYHKVLYGYCNMLASLVQAEAPGSTGTPDLVITFFDDSLFAVIELKYKYEKQENADLDRTVKKLAEEAMEAIRTKKYCEPYVTKAKQLVAIGLGVTNRGKCLALLEDRSKVKKPKTQKAKSKAAAGPAAKSKAKRSRA